MNRRQRKKRRVGEFLERTFELSVVFKTALTLADWGIFIDDVCEQVASRGLGLGGFGGRMPLAATDGWIQKCGRGSTTDVQCQDLIAWLLHRPEVKEASPGAWVDAWHDCEAENLQSIVLARRESTRLLELLESPPKRNEKFRKPMTVIRRSSVM